MAIDFERVKQEIVSAGKDVGAKAKEVSSVAKIRLDIRAKEDFLEKQYAALGRAYYSAHKDEDVPEETVFAIIREAEEELERLKDELLTLQGAVVCPSCGLKQPDDSSYCKNCGASLHG